MKDSTYPKAYYSQRFEVYEYANPSNVNLLNFVRIEQKKYY